MPTNCLEGVLKEMFPAIEFYAQMRQKIELFSTTNTKTKRRVWCKKKDIYTEINL